MTISTRLENFFKPEVRKHGAELVAKEVVSLSSGSDTAVQGYVRGSGNNRVNFTASSIASKTFIAGCTCTSAGKGVFCKHIWAVLLTAEKRYPDFFDSKTNIEIKSVGASTESSVAAKAESTYKAEQKAKQAEYQKAQYEKQKVRAKEIRQRLKQKARGIEDKPSYPEEVEQALAYFSDNGFPMAPPFDQEELKSAKKKLARIFHPDKGGTQAESVMLNDNFEILIDHMSR